MVFEGASAQPMAFAVGCSRIGASTTLARAALSAAHSRLDSRCMLQLNTFKIEQSRWLCSARAGGFDSLVESKWGRRTNVLRGRSTDVARGWGRLLATGPDSEGAAPETMKTVVIQKEDASEPGVVLAPDFRLALSVLAVGLQLWRVLEWTTCGIFLTFIGGFLTLQTARLRFRFTGSTIDVLRVQGLSDTGQEDAQRPDTVIGADSDIGGTGGTIDLRSLKKSRAIGPWAYSSIVNWEFWWPGFPVLAYFKETQAKETGQRHFFPVIMDGKALYEQMLKNFGKSETAKPPVEEWQQRSPLHPYGYTHYKQDLVKWWGKTERYLALRTKLEQVKTMVEGMLDADQRQVTIEKIQVIWQNFKLWAEKNLQDVTAAVKQFMASKSPSK